MCTLMAIPPATVAPYDLSRTGRMLILLLVFF